MIHLLTVCLIATAAPPPFQATGVKVGEVTDTGALVWVRLTADPVRNATGLRFSRSTPRLCASRTRRLEKC